VYGYIEYLQPKCFPTRKYEERFEDGIYYKNMRGMESPGVNNKPLYKEAIEAVATARPSGNVERARSGEGMVIRRQAAEQKVAEFLEAISFDAGAPVTLDDLGEEFNGEKIRTHYTKVMTAETDFDSIVALGGLLMDIGNAPESLKQPH
jgi:hypothetical protein